jgi:hypothetical protein
VSSCSAETVFRTRVQSATDTSLSLSLTPSPSSILCCSLYETHHCMLLFSKVLLALCTSQARFLSTSPPAPPKRCPFLSSIISSYRQQQHAKRLQLLPSIQTPLIRNSRTHRARKQYCSFLGVVNSSKRQAATRREIRKE